MCNYSFYRFSTLNTKLGNKIDKYDLSYLGVEDNVVKTGETFGERDVYCKLISVTNIPNNAAIRIDTDLSGLYHYWIDPSYSFAFNQGGSRYPIPYVDVRDPSNSLSCAFYTESQITLASSTDWSEYSGFICIKFTYD